MNKAIEKTLIVLLSVAAVFLAPATASAAETFGFTAITSNSVVDPGIGESQLSVDVIDLGTQVEFLFMNSGPAASSITDIYFDTATPGYLGSTMTFTDIVGTVSFAQGANPGNLPSGKNVGFVTSGGLSADSNSPKVPQNGINPGEQMGIVLNLANGATYQDVVDQMVTGDIRVGIHVQAFADGGSESFVTVVPAPGSIALGAIGLGLVRMLRSRKQIIA